MPETQDSVIEWADRTFGKLDSNARAVVRAIEEMTELLRLLVTDPADPRVGEEIADVIIVLYRPAARLGGSIRLVPADAPHTPLRAAATAGVSLHHLLVDLAQNDACREAFYYLQRAVCYLCRAATELGVDVQAEIDRKMAVNRARSWKLDGTGHGYHVKGAP